jgi:hypothetical protein
VTRERTRGAVLDRLRLRRLYGSSGPEVHDLRLARDAFRCAARPLARFVLRSGRCVAARLERPEFHSWGRVEIEAADGGRAWSGVVYGNG